jgi:hypothetical protein
LLSGWFGEAKGDTKGRVGGYQRLRSIQNQREQGPKTQRRKAARRVLSQAKHFAMRREWNSSQMVFDYFRGRNNRVDQDPRVKNQKV